MTATDRLRALLDERGVEWWNETDPHPQNVTVARLDGRVAFFHENANGTVGYSIHNSYDLTPEQAVEATLGRGTCHARNDEDTCGHDVCSGCGFVWPDDYSINYCPNCGRRVIA